MSIADWIQSGPKRSDRLASLQYSHEDGGGANTHHTWTRAGSPSAEMRAVQLGAWQSRRKEVPLDDVDRTAEASMTSAEVLRSTARPVLVQKPSGNCRTGGAPTGKVGDPLRVQFFPSARCSPGTPDDNTPPSDLVDANFSGKVERYYALATPRTTRGYPGIRPLLSGSWQ